MKEILTLAGWAAGGVLLGLIYFHIVRYSADLMLSARRGGPWLGIVLVLLRMAGLGGVLLVAAMQGVRPLLTASLGLLIGRMIVMRSQQRST